jgi:hypothetical protein
MKQIVMAVTAAFMMATAANAQDNQQRPDRRMDSSEMIQRRTDNTVKTYGLNEEQAKKLLELNKKYADKMGPRMGGPRGGRRGGGPRMRPDGQTGASPMGGNGEGRRPEMTEEQRQQMETFRKEREEAMKQYETELQTIMTADQYKAYQADQQKRMQEGPRGFRPNRDR